jgi:glutamate-1-semialdehyde 2,1-aminomutase
LFWIHSGATTNIRSIEQLPKDQSEGFKSLFLDLLDKNIYLAPNAYEVGFLSLAHTSEVLDTVIQTIQGL